MISGHFDLLYRSEDLMEISQNAHCPTEIKIASDPVYHSFGDANFRQDEIFDSSIMDLPGLTMNTPMTAFSSGQSYPGPLPIMASPTHSVCSQLAQTNLGSARIENNVLHIQPTCSELATEDKFRGSKLELAYRDCRAMLRSEKARAGLSE